RAGAVRACALILDHFPGAAALRAGPGHGEESLGVAHLSAAAATGARDRLRAGLGAAAVADLARGHARNVDGDVFAEDRFLEFEGEVVAEIVASGSTRGT